MSTIVAGDIGCRGQLRCQHDSSCLTGADCGLGTTKAAHAGDMCFGSEANCGGCTKDLSIVYTGLRAVRGVERAGPVGMLHQSPGVARKPTVEDGGGRRAPIFSESVLSSNTHLMAYSSFVPLSTCKTHDIPPFPIMSRRHVYSMKKPIYNEGPSLLLLLLPAALGQTATAAPQAGSGLALLLEVNLELIVLELVGVCLSFHVCARDAGCANMVWEGLDVGQGCGSGHWGHRRGRRGHLHRGSFVRGRSSWNEGGPADIVAGNEGGSRVQSGGWWHREYGRLQARLLNTDRGRSAGVAVLSGCREGVRASPDEDGVGGQHQIASARRGRQRRWGPGHSSCDEGGGGRRARTAPPGEVESEPKKGEGWRSALLIRSSSTLPCPLRIASHPYEIPIPHSLFPQHTSYEDVGAVVQDVGNIWAGGIRVRLLGLGLLAANTEWRGGQLDQWSAATRRRQQELSRCLVGCCLHRRPRSAEGIGLVPSLGMFGRSAVFEVLKKSRRGHVPGGVEQS
ncbi:hypothetical protein B0H17DRAFT_1136035 [Mycena rosella]|uniref:Uncharacterized protein n=1 Tax=Mycena rosella TaxID=1033263 RepID=A0AAD7GCF0_MYCRO|nr:hypothetical protein B0H17DRAFT_1136035 [Mycena rosella]